VKRDAKGVVTRLKIDRAEAAFLEKLDADLRGLKEANSPVSFSTSLGSR
jgi:hypothetical protein